MPAPLLRRGRWLAVALLAWALPATASLSLQEVELAPPEELSAEIAALLQPTAMQLLDGEHPVWEFWWVKAVPLETAPDDGPAGPANLGITTLLGVARVHTDQRDYRDDDIYAGTYTLRYAAMPQDGNHLGAAPFDSFALLVPADQDLEPATFGTQRGLQNASKEDTATGHPVGLSLRPATVDPEGLPALTEPEAGHRSLELRLSAVVDDASTELVMGLVFEGHGKL